MTTLTLKPEWSDLAYQEFQNARTHNGGEGAAIEAVLKLVLPLIVAEQREIDARICDNWTPTNELSTEDCLIAELNARAIAAAIRQGSKH